MTLKVKMLPHLKWFETGESGIHTVVRNYFKYLPDYDIELVDPQAKRYDLLAVHAGSLDATPPKAKPIVSHLHGVYFTADYNATKNEYRANRNIVNILHYAKEVTVPSKWVAETFERDCRFTPHIVGHGVDWQAWQHDYAPQDYVLAYMKNRVGDVCDNSFIPELARRFKGVRFVCTFAPRNSPSNVISLDGTIPHEEMRKLIQQSWAVISPVKETFGLLTLEAMAAGKPVLGINKGGNVDLIKHGETGYLYGEDDMLEGLDYCLEHAETLGENGRELARGYTWQKVCEQIAGIYRKAMEVEEPSVSVIIPVYNKTFDQVERVVDSCINQSLKPDKIVIVDDGSQNQDEILKAVELYRPHSYVNYIRQENQGVAAARNNGIAQTNSKYVCCLDADDWLDPQFLEVCVNALEADNSLGIAYTGLTSHEPDGTVQLSPGNPYWDYDRHIAGQNTVWTCNVFRREMWERLGGYRSRYCPDGAGSEDAELWLRSGAYGYKAEKVTNKGLFHYSWKSGLVTGNPDYREPDYRAWHPWVEDGHHPMASYATPINKVSHPIRQYDEPVISVIIPVGPGHEQSVIDALDSLEAQRFRKWEAIVIWDAWAGVEDLSREQIELDIEKSCPYVRVVFTNQRGTGYARNRGVEIARGDFILFLDADDTLRPIDALSKMLGYWNEHQAAIYTDYVGQAFINEESAKQLSDEGRLESYNPKTGEAIITYKRQEFDCQRALKEPTDIDTAYNWNLVTTLLPKVWHDAIGGFDEKMETLEDWDYWLRLAKAGYCFKHLPEKLVRYRLRAGERHIELDSEIGRQNALDVIKYIKRKHEQIEIKDMTCGCKNGKSTPTQTKIIEATTAMNDDDFVKAVYTGRRGNHHIMGAYVFPEKPELPSRRRGDGWVLHYGYDDKGLETYVHKQDVNLMPGKWEVKPDVVRPVTPKKETPAPQPTKSPMERLEESRLKARQETQDVLEFDLENLSAVTPAIAKRMSEAGLTSPHRILQAGMDGLQEIKGIGEARAEAILDELS